MNRMIRSSRILLALFSTATLFASAQSDANSDATGNGKSSPVAFVYVNEVLDEGTPAISAQVEGFTAASDGKLTPVSGSPFNENIVSLANDGSYLFGGTFYGSNINSYFMDSEGNISYRETIDTSSDAPIGCSTVGPLVADHSGKTLYNTTLTSDCTENAYQAFAVDHSSGKLKYVKASAESAGGELTFTGNNKFAYAANCLYPNGKTKPGSLMGYERQSNGELQAIDTGDALPKTKEAEHNYCPTEVAADPDGHLAVLMFDEDAEGSQYGNSVIATYKVDSHGKLTTTSTYKDMPQAPKDAFGMRMSPSGKLLVVGGSKGLKIFHFNGSSQVSLYKSLLSDMFIDSVYWDKSNHLYVAASPSEDSDFGELYVYTATPTSVSEASGSPYKVANPIQVIVQNR